MISELPILNLSTATYECTFGRGCDGVCCREGRPLVYPEEIERLDAALERILPLLRREARAAVTARGYLTTRRRLGQRLTRNVGGWCVFFNQGCVLHQLGASEGNKFRYKPAVCSLFPIQQDEHDQWYVRQQGYKGDRWDLFCLDPDNTKVKAAESLHEEIALAAYFDALANELPATTNTEPTAMDPRAT